MLYLHANQIAALDKASRSTRSCLLARWPGQLVALGTTQGVRLRRLATVLGAVGLQDPRAINCQAARNSQADLPGRRPGSTPIHLATQFG